MSLEDKNVKNNAEDGGLTCEISERSLKGHVLFWIKILWFRVAGAEESPAINKTRKLRKQIFALLGYLMLIGWSLEISTD